MAKKRFTRRIRRTTVKRGGSRKMTLPLAVIAGFAVPVTHSINAYKGGGGVSGAFNQLSMDMTGVSAIDNTFQFTRLKSGLLPVVAGIMVHKAAGYLGINRALAQCGIPLVRI